MDRDAAEVALRTTIHDRVVLPSPGRKRAWLVAIVLVAYIICVGAKLTVCQFDITRFITAGDHFVTPKRLVYPIAVEANSEGYDGQFFYRLALNPATTRRIDYGISMQAHPAVRAQRILYPAAVWLLTLGHGNAVPYVMVAVNLLSLGTLGWIAISLADEFALSIRLGLLIPFYLGFVLSIYRNTAEIVATTLAVGGLLAASKRRWPLAALLASAAVLTRETTLLYFVGYGFVAVFDSIRARQFDKRIIWCLIPFVVFLVWQAALKIIWGNFAYEVIGHDDLSPLPLVQYISAVTAYAEAIFLLPIRYRVIFSFVTCLFVAVFAASVIAAVVRSRRFPVAYLIPWGLYVGLTMTFTMAIWREPWGYLRILCDFYVLGIVTLLACGHHAILRRLIPMVAVTWIASVAYAL